MDASGSIGAENFRSELNFVTKLLSDFTVDTMATRVALVTFGGRGNIYRNVDQISKHGPNDHKCYLLNKQFSNITYSGGGTYTRGALLEALVSTASSVRQRCVFDIDNEIITFLLLHGGKRKSFGV